MKTVELSIKGLFFPIIQNYIWLRALSRFWTRCTSRTERDELYKSNKDFWNHWRYTNWKSKFYCNDCL